MSAALASNQPVVPPSGLLVHLDKIGLTFADHLGRPLPVLSNIDLTVAPGEIVALLGPSGCGKTSLLRVIAHLIAPTCGSAFVDPGLLAERGLEMSMVFQRPVLLPWLTVEENVWWPLRGAGMKSVQKARELGDDLLRLVRLHGFREAMPAELSGGMQMRVSLARAFLTSPRLILMDEPLSALDELTRIDLGLEMTRLAAKLGCAVLFVTHSIAEAVLVADRIVTLRPRPGRIAGQTIVPFAQPRERKLLDDPEYVKLCGLVRAQLQHV